MIHQYEAPITRSVGDAKRAIRAATKACRDAAFAREVVLLSAIEVCDWNGLSPREIARELGRSTKFIKKALRMRYRWETLPNERDRTTPLVARRVI
ncbi:hypothetical protein [Cryobacterium sp. RTS3]|uniref:terminase gpP N-terminus-related DNA-binding protein n=1 Tax=Cryobacterium sp. RTS3 TaxID=3048643 RepID=UPI0034DD6022